MSGHYQKLDEVLHRHGLPVFDSDIDTSLQVSLILIGVLERIGDTLERMEQRAKAADDAWKGDFVMAPNGEANNV